MYQGKRIIGMIPARGGSKGIPRKNIRLLDNKPLIAWTIEQALSCKYLDRVIVSTEDKEIIDIAQKYGAEVPFLRPAHLATDKADIMDAILLAVDLLEKNNEVYDILVLLQPTSPLRTSTDIDKALELLTIKKAQAIVSVCETEHHPYWVNTLPPDRCMKDFIKPEIKNKNRQEFPVYYRLNGAIYLSYCDYLRRQNNFLGDDTFAYIMPVERSIDIDNELDFKFAEFLLKEDY